MSFSVLVADDHFPVRFGLELLTKETLGANTKVDFASDFDSVLEKIRAQHYDLLISDIIMPGIDCMSMMAEALSLRPSLKILFVSVNPKEVFALRYMNAGAYGYVCKTDSDEELKKAIRNIYLGKRYYPDGVLESKTMMVKGKRVNSLFDLLSQREFAVMMLLLEGKGIIEIANTLHLNPSTASTYRGRIFEKLKIKSLIELSNLAREHNFSLD